MVIKIPICQNIKHKYHFPKIHKSVLRKIIKDLLHFRGVYDVIYEKKFFGRSTAYSCRTNIFV